MTELIWEGKYDAQGRKVAPPRIALPFQTVETVNESAADRDRMQDLFASGRPTEWRNRLIWGDKKYVLPSLLQEFAGQIKLIYIDPPFDTGANFSFTATIPDDPNTDDNQSATFFKQPNVIEQKAYRDTWGKGLDGYLKWFYETVVLLRELLSDSGTLFAHSGFNMNSHIRVLLDEVFGPSGYVNEIVWKRRTGYMGTYNKFGVVTDSILFYAKGVEYLFAEQTGANNPEYLERFKYKDKSGRLYRLDNLTSPNPRPNLKYIYKGYQPPENGWAVSREKMEQMEREGRLDLPADKSRRIQRRRFLDELKGQPVQNLWDDIPPVNPMAEEGSGYPTQKPAALLERIMSTSSNEGDLILDCFSGSGTTAVVAEKLDRRWVTCDLGRFAIHTTRKRLLGIPGVKPFVVQNLGKYERQAWQAAEFGESAEAATQAYRRFVLELYHAEAITGYVWLHGSKSGRMVHVGGVDAPVTRADVTGIVTEFKKAMGRGKDAPKRSGVDVLGWDFAFELNETARQDAELAGIDLRLIRIPRELLEKKAVEQGDIKFFELAALSVSVKKRARSVTLELTDFMIPLDDVPEEVQKAVTHWEQWIDYWAVDWDNSDDTFHNEWQAYRTRKDKTLERRTTHTYAEPGTYRVVVKVIDILGNDTTKLLQVEVR